MSESEISLIDEKLSVIKENGYRNMMNDIREYLKESGEKTISASHLSAVFSKRQRHNVAFPTKVSVLRAAKHLFEKRNLDQEQAVREALSA